MRAAIVPIITTSWLFAFVGLDCVEAGGAAARISAASAEAVTCAPMKPRFSPVALPCRKGGIPPFQERVGHAGDDPFEQHRKLHHDGGERVRREGYVLAVEIAAMCDRLAVRIALRPGGEDERIVGRARQFALDHIAVKPRDIDSRADELRQAAQRIVILRHRPVVGDALVVERIGLDHRRQRSLLGKARRSGRQAMEGGMHRRLARMRPRSPKARMRGT